MDFAVGQVFLGCYPAEAADWCNASGQAHIEEILRDDVTGERRFKIVLNDYDDMPQPVPDRTAERLDRLEAALAALAARVTALEAE